jgi:hypothetical protein
VSIIINEEEFPWKIYFTYHDTTWSNRSEFIEKVIKNDCQGVKKLLNDDVDVNEIDDYGLTGMYF